jgi:hypothetical protein
VSLSLRPPDLDNLVDPENPDERPDARSERLGRAHLSHSKIGTMLACERRYELHYEERLQLIRGRPALDLGRAFHEAIEKGDPEYGAQTYSKDRIASSQEEQDKILVNEQIIRSAATLYLTKWGTADAPEVPYRIRLRNPETGRPSVTVDLEGRADGVMLHTGEEEPYIELVEAKLVGAITNQKVELLKLDRQVTLGSYALWRVMGVPVRKVRFRWVRKPSIKQKQTETIGQYLERLEADYEERADDFYAHEETVTRAPADYLRIEQELWEWAERLRNLRQENKVFPRNTGACSDFGGCQFIPICVGDPDALSLYERRERETNDAHAAV